MNHQIYIYSDESISNGKYCSNFYGGAILLDSHNNEVKKILNSKKEELDIKSEIKWNKISENNHQKYIEFIDCLFDLVKQKMIKIRIMFLQNDVIPILTNDQKQDGFLRLYYSFLRDSFGLECAELNHNMNINFIFDHIPQSKQKKQRFKQYLCNDCLNYYNKRRVDYSYSFGSIKEQSSKNCIILQSVDLVLGAIQAKLNKKFDNTVQNKGKLRPKKNRIKEKVYNIIKKHVKNLYSGYHFNFGISTGLRGDYKNKYNDPYTHWKFKPKNAKRNNCYKPKNN